MRTGTLGNGDNGQWGWGYYFPQYMDTQRITVENQALGGISSRTFYTQLWPNIRQAVKASGHTFRVSIGGLWSELLSVV
jgi:hypothetical protein